MKYGETLRQRSIPEWGHYNVDYDEIKYLIKEHTTPGTAKAVSIPGQGSPAEEAFEAQLYSILCDQHQRINLFVKSKTGEIERRLAHLSKQVAQLESREQLSGTGRIPARRLERYARIEGEVLKAGQEIRSLSRFIGAQRLAFVKLLKKYKKWTNSDTLGAKFKREVMQEPGNFCTMDLGPLLDHWSDVLHAVRAPFEAKVRTGQGRGDAHIEASPSRPGQAKDDPEANPSIAKQIQDVIDRGLDVDFDLAISTLPFGPSGGRAVYWVHPDNIVELQVLMLQHMRLHIQKDKARTPMNGTPFATPPRRNSSPRLDSNLDDEVDTGMLVLDDLATFVAKRNRATLSENEGTPGRPPTTVAGSARWHASGDAIVAVGLQDENEMKVARIKRKHLDDFLDVEKAFSRRPSVDSANEDNSRGANETSEEALNNVRNWLSTHRSIQPLVSISTKRTRFVGLVNGISSGTWAVLDQHIFMQKDIPGPKSSTKVAGSFPFAVLEIRKEGNQAGELIKTLDRSHLAERVRGFSLETHAVWMCCKPASMSPPFWLPILSKDIRKVPEAQATRRGRVASLPGDPISPIRTHTSTSATSVTDATGSPGRNGESSATSTADHLEVAPLSAFRKKRMRSNRLSKCVESENEAASVGRYWSEYDHPEDGSDNEVGAYVIYVDPNARTKFPGQDAVLNWLNKLFKRNKSSEPEHEHNPLLSGPSSAGYPDNDASDVESLSSTEIARGYGTLPRSLRPRDVATPAQPEQRLGFFASFFHPDHRPYYDPSLDYVSALELSAQERERNKVRLCALSLLAAVGLLVVVMLLAATGRRKQAEEVHVGILFGVVMDLCFAITAVGSVVTTRKDVGWLRRIVVWGVFAAVVVGDGALLGWIIG